MYKVVLMQRRSMNFDFIYRTFIISNKIDSGKITIFIIRNPEQILRYDVVQCSFA